MQSMHFAFICLDLCRLALPRLFVIYSYLWTCVVCLYPLPLNSLVLISM